MTEIPSLVVTTATLSGYKPSALKTPFGLNLSR
jgi:hypothetical protein